MDIVEKIEVALNEGATKIQIKNMETSLSNDEDSTDKELLNYFTKEVGVDEKTAKKFIKKRDEYLRGEH